MSSPTSTVDLRIRATKPLLAPAILEEEIPLDAARAALVARTRREVAAIVTGADARAAFPITVVLNVGEQRTLIVLSESQQR
jgi:phospho-2-dehydro-3-deoxyheptonate aldolase